MIQQALDDRLRPEDTLLSDYERAEIEVKQLTRQIYLKNGHLPDNILFTDTHAAVRYDNIQAGIEYTLDYRDGGFLVDIGVNDLDSALKILEILE